MKRLLFFFGAVSFLLAACHQKDVVTDFKAQNTDAWRTQFVHQLQTAKNDSERQVLMEQNGVHLTTQLIAFLRSQGFPCSIDTIIYRYGSGTADSVSSGDGKKHTGTFSSQPYAIVKGDSCFNDSLFVFILCFNGTFTIHSTNSVVIGSSSPKFVIEKGKGLTSYVDYETSIWIARHFHLPLYKGKFWDSTKVISPDEALRLIPYLRKTQVTVRVFTGDRFDLGNMTYNGVP